MALAVCVAKPSPGAEPTQPKPPTPPGTYLNPLGDPPIHLQDPFILPCAKKYYLFGTASPSEGFPCYESVDLVHWSLDGWAWRKTGLHVARGDLHSPQVFPYQGMFCLIYSGRTPTGIHLGLAASIKPEGPYHDLHVPWLPLGPGCVAADLFVAGKGNPFLTFTQASLRAGGNYRALYGVELNKDLTSMIGQPVKLLEPNQHWELAQRKVDRLNDSPRMFRLGSSYYLTYCANDPHSSACAIGYAMAEAPLGPWTKGPKNPILHSRPDLGVFGPGHASIFRSLDQSDWFLVYDSLTNPGGHPEDHMVNVDRLLVQGDGSLTVNGPTRSPQPLSGSAR